MDGARILLVEDELRLLDYLKEILVAEGFSVEAYSTHIELESMLAPEQSKFDLIVLDRLLHGQDAALMIEKIRAAMLAPKIMILSAINTPGEKAAILDRGADDYVAKPFAPEEIIARVRALLRRDQQIARLSNVILSSYDRSVKVNNQEISFPNKEFILLRSLLKVPGRICSKSFLHRQVWEMNDDVETNVVESTINKLRRRLEDSGARIKIRNSRNVGYWIEE